MRREIVRLREELELAKTRTTPGTSSNHHRDDIREEIESLRAEIRNHNITSSSKFSPKMTPRSPRFGGGGEGVVARMRDEFDLVQTRNPRQSLSSTRNNDSREELNTLRNEIQSPPQYGGRRGGGSIGGLYESRLHTPNESRFYTPNESRLFTPNNESRAAFTPSDSRTSFTPKERRVFTPSETRLYTPQARRYFS